MQDDVFVNTASDSPALARSDARKVFGISELTSLVKNVIEDEVGDVWVEGEISNMSRPASGHMYFTLKDENAQLSAVLFRSGQRYLSFQPENGMVVQAFGTITVYVKGGRYQIVVRKLEEGGQGALQARFERLKKKLMEEGLFDPERKKPLPILPSHIAVVTSSTGAAIRDILNVITRRFRNIRVSIGAVRVQGQGASEEIAEMIERLNMRDDIDVIITGRGGGSLEDLWCFNEECVARAIAACSIPVISAVGHETDFTISDFVADLRAPTPSAAAELVVGRKEDFAAMLQRLSSRMTFALRQKSLRLKNRLTAASGSYVFREPGNLAARHRHRLSESRLRIRHALTDSANRYGQRLDDLNSRAVRQMRDWTRDLSNVVGRRELQLKALNPLAVLDRGYSITFTEDNDVLRSAMEIEPGCTVRTRLGRGEILSEVKRTDAGKEKGKA